MNILHLAKNWNSKLVFNHDEKKELVKFKKEGPITTDKSSLFYNKKYSFIEFKNVAKYMDDLFKNKTYI